MNSASTSVTQTSLIPLLLVDDRRENLLALESLLQGEHTQIYKAHSGREALELLLKHRFALAILDVQMPEINGFELAELMRGSEHTREIPIIFVTAGAIDAGWTFRGYEAGAIDFLYKPLDPHIVKSKVKAYVRIEQQRLQILAQMEQLQSALRVREEFLSIASHELKTPLTSMALQIQVAQRSTKQEAAKNPVLEKLARTFDVANRQVAKLERLIDDLLDISRIQAGKLTVSKTPVNLPHLIQDVVERMAPQLSAAGCAVRLDLPDTLIVPCDSSRIEQVLTNLIANVIKYASGSPLTISAAQEGGSVFFKINDQGPGIPNDQLTTIFKRFERVETKKSVGGLGLGLYIVRQIMLAHGGDIHAESKLGEGATFTAHLPLQTTVER